MRMDTILIDDILGKVINLSNNYYCISVCKKWYNLIAKHSPICNTCNKIIKMYDNILWITDEKDDICHGYYGKLEEYRQLKREMLGHSKNNQQIISFLKIKRQTIGLCIMFVKHNVNALKYVRTQTEFICLVAVKKNGLQLQYVEEQTYEICVSALKQNIFAFQYASDKYKTQELYLTIVKYNGTMLQYISEIDQTEIICLEAIKSNPYAIQYVINQTQQLCFEALKRNPKVSKYIKKLI